MFRIPPPFRNVYRVTIFGLFALCYMLMPHTSIAFAAFGAALLVACWPIATRWRWWWIPFASAVYGFGHLAWTSYISSPRIEEVVGNVGLVLFGIIGNATLIVSLLVKSSRGTSRSNH